MIKIVVDKQKLSRVTSAIKSAASTTGTGIRNGIGNTAGFIARHMHHAELELKKIPHDDRTLAVIAKDTTPKPVARATKHARRK